MRFNKCKTLQSGLPDVSTVKPTNNKQIKQFSINTVYLDNMNGQVTDLYISDVPE